MEKIQQQRPHLRNGECFRRCAPHRPDTHCIDSHYFSHLDPKRTCTIRIVFGISNYAASFYCGSGRLEYFVLSLLVVSRYFEILLPFDHFRNALKTEYMSFWCPIHGKHTTAGKHLAKLFMGLHSSLENELWHWPCWTHAARSANESVRATAPHCDATHYSRQQYFYRFDDQFPTFSIAVAHWRYGNMTKNKIFFE